MLTSRSPLFLVHSFSSAVFPEGYFSRMLPLTAPYSISVPFKTVVSTNPVPGFPSRESFMAGWGPRHHLSLRALLLGEPCYAIWVVRTVIILPQMIYQPQTSCVFLSIFLAISGMTHVQHYTVSFTFIVLFPEQSIFVYARIPVIVNIGIIFGGFCCISSCSGSSLMLCMSLN